LHTISYNTTTRADYGQQLQESFSLQFSPRPDVQRSNDYSF